MKMPGGLLYVAVTWWRERMEAPVGQKAKELDPVPARVSEAR